MARCHIIPACLIIVRFAACSDISPVPPVTPGPDTTSHDWTFTMYEVGAMNTTLEDVFALSPDYALAVGKIVRTGPYIRPQVNAFLWNGSSLTPISLPIDPNDTLTIDPHKHPDTQSSYGILNALWVFRRDNIWYSSEAGAIAHMTTRGADTAVKQYPYPRFGPAIASAGLRIWAKDTGEIYFAGHQSRVAKYLNGSWFPIPAGSENEAAVEIFGTPTSLFLVTSNYPESSFKMFKDNAWRTIWKEGLPSLSDRVFFGRPNVIWGFPEDDSVWLSGLWLGRYSVTGTGFVHPLFDLHPHGYTRIRGSTRNDVFFAGTDGMITHYNGRTFHDFTEFLNKNIWFLGISVIPDHVFIVGYRRWGGGVFIHGKRTK